MERKLPVTEIEGTRFLVDVGKQILIEEADKDNTISFSQMSDKEEYYVLEYSRAEKNLPSLFHDDEAKRVRVAPMKELDPEGMMLIYGCSKEDIKTKTDFELVVDQEVIAERLAGKQPTLLIDGHTFFVDLHWGYLRPKDDFSTMGISFRDLEDHGEEVNDFHFHAPYDTKKHELAIVDWDKITEIPKDVIIVDIPPPHQLDPVKWAKMNGFEIRDIARRYPPKQEHEARIVPWSETRIDELIRENKTRLQQQQENKQQQSPAKEQKKGRKI